MASRKTLSQRVVLVNGRRVGLYGPQRRQRPKQLGFDPVLRARLPQSLLSSGAAGFVIGGHYPALVGCCALGERILNHLVHEFRYDFEDTPQYKLVYDKKSFDDSNRAIDVLEAWELLLPDVVTDYRQLRTRRNDAIHFRTVLMNPPRCRRG